MAKRIGVTASEMMAMREQGLSNKDIANLLEINPLTVRRYIGCQPQRHMENMAAFKETPKTRVEPETVEVVETPEIKRAVDEIVCMRETISSKSGSVCADVDYTMATVKLSIEDMTFDELPEFATFIIGMVERIRARE